MTMKHTYDRDVCGFIKQAYVLTLANARSFPLRLSSSLISMLSIACVTAVILSVLVMVEGMMKTLDHSGMEDTVLVMRAGSVSELQSVMFLNELKILADNASVARDESGHAKASAELFVSAELAYEDSDGHDLSTSLALRGLSLSTLQFRPGFNMEQGRFFTPGLRQLIIGKAVARRIPDLKLGATVTLAGAQWQVSGVFSDQNSAFESELWADLGVLQSDYQRGPSVQTIRLALTDIKHLDALRAEWAKDPRLNIRVTSESVFFADQADSLTRLVRYIGFPVSAIMAIGAMVAALSTMYSAVASRSKEIATQKAIGFGPFAIAASILFESIFIAFLGALFGMVPLYVVFDGWTATTHNTVNLSQLMFNFDLDLSLLLKALSLALLIGIIGGLLPAIKAMRLSVVDALRD
ncbi:ABC transporter permease [Agaribacterium sp. ZY112]|uniref:ABC transporter permease n=1 Tax=Agaribacterium sp. ZY112 TaxID=3233574 RepID=UPI0035255811